MSAVMEVLSANGRDRAVAEVFPTPVPGLVIVADPWVPGTFNVVHARSRCGAAHGLPDPELALHVAIELGKVIDWTVPAVVIRRSKGCRQRWRRVIRATGAAAYFDDRGSVPDAALVTAEAVSGRA